MKFYKFLRIEIPKDFEEQIKWKEVYVHIEQSEKNKIILKFLDHIETKSKFIKKVNVTDGNKIPMKEILKDELDINDIRNYTYQRYLQNNTMYVSIKKVKD